MLCTTPATGSYSSLWVWNNYYSLALMWLSEAGCEGFKKNYGMETFFKKLKRIN